MFVLFFWLVGLFVCLFVYRLVRLCVSGWLLFLNGAIWVSSGDVGAGVGLGDPSDASRAADASDRWRSERSCDAGDSQRSSPVSQQNTARKKGKFIGYSFILSIERHDGCLGPKELDVSAG